MSGHEPGTDILEIEDDFAFGEAWRALSDEARSAIGPAGFTRFIKLNGNVSDSIESLTREQARIAAAAPVPAAGLAPRVSNLIDWSELNYEPEPFPWIMDHWLSWHPTLLAGRGGIGKSLLIQHVLTALAVGAPTWCAATAPLHVLYWACEDDREQLHRRQNAICKHMQIGFDRLARLETDARYGLDNTLLASVYGQPKWTFTIEVLRQQVNDLNIDVLAIDNIGHTFGANENVRHDVTMFLNGIAGLVTDRPFCPIVLGHPSKAVGSEYSGSTAWENAVRMRWYLDDKLPDQKGDPDQKPDPDYRVLSKRKYNYTRPDYVQLKFDGGVLVPEQVEQGEPATFKAMRARRGRAIVLSAIDTLAQRQVYGNNTKSRYYLPKIIIDNKLSDGYTKAELEAALTELIFDAEIEESVMAKNAAGKPIIGFRRKV